MIPSLPHDLEEFVQQELEDASYQSRDDLLVDAVRLLRDQKRRLETVREQVRMGRQQIERGEGVLIEDDHSLRTFLMTFNRAVASVISKQRMENEPICYCSSSQG